MFLSSAFLLRPFSTAKAIQRSALSLQRVDNIHGRHGLPLRVLTVRDLKNKIDLICWLWPKKEHTHSVPDDIFQEHLQHGARFLVDQARDALDTATTGKTPDGWLGDPLDVVAQHLERKETLLC